MRAARFPIKTLKFKMPTPLVSYLLMIILGILTGLSNIAVLQDMAVVIADIFIKIFKCISIPIIALSIIVTLSNYTEQGIIPKLWRKTIFYTLTTTYVAALVSFGLYILIRPGNVQIDVPQTVAPAVEASYLKHLSNLVPSNLFTPFLEQQVLTVLFMGIIIGIALRYIPDQAAKNTLTQFFKGLYSLFLVITKWIVTILPIGLFGFVATTVMQLHKGVNFAGLGQYLLIVVLANCLQGFLILPLWLTAKGLPPWRTMQKMLPALSIAFFSKSSAGVLPITMETAEKNLKVNPQISRFVLPLCTSLNMNGCAAFIFATVIYLMQNNGLDVSLSTMLLWTVIATIAAIGNAGVPMGCFFLSASLLSGMNVPILLLGIILPFYSIIDMIETALNVWSDSCVVAVVNEANNAVIPVHSTVIPANAGIQKDYLLDPRLREDDGG